MNRLRPLPARSESRAKRLTMCTAVRNFLRFFRRVHQYLSGYAAMCAFVIALKRIAPAFISALVALHWLWT